MNRLFRVVLVLLLLLSFASVYIFIPRVLLITSIKTVKSNPNGVARILREDSSWRNRWQGGSVSGYVYQLRGKAFHEMDIAIITGSDSALSRLTILDPGGMDTVALQWKYISKTSLNPFRRVQQYRQAVRDKRMMDTVLTRICVYLEDNRNIYGIPMVDSMSNDSALLVMRLKTAAYPSTAEIYRAVAAIRAYIKAAGAQPINYPMLHVSADNGEYESIVALSVDRRLKGTALIEPKRYVPWKIVAGEVRGGVYSAEQAMERLQEYVTDHQKPAMGLPFQSLVTDRDREPDTARWVTRVVQAVP